MVCLDFWGFSLFVHLIQVLFVFLGLILSAV